MRQILLGINQSCSRCPRVQIIPEFYSTKQELQKIAVWLRSNKMAFKHLLFRTQGKKIYNNDCNKQ